MWQQAVGTAKPINALALGEREGGLSLWLASSGLKVHCTDLGPFDEAIRKLHKKYEIQDLITYGAQDATDLTLESSSYDLVIFKSMIGALGTKEKQRQAINEMHRVLRPGGLLLFAENLKASLVHEKLRQRFVRWTSYWRYLHLRNDEDLFAAFSAHELYTYGLLAAFGRTERQRRLLGLLDRVLCPMTPGSWHYILYGVLRK